MKNGHKHGTNGSDIKVRRCAVYTRKSTEKGLDQEFNSLDAQREACELYVRSQAHLGWKLTAEPYDDGGFTGANLERPAFQRLMADVEARKIDVVVVYKVDRLSRSLLDFARVMDRFNQAGIDFVSVTQNFSTADAMGRLTLNMLMSFAEFEREMIGERTRDKMAAARRRGKWTGGAVPLGYDVVEKKLVVNDLEAVVVREVYDLYLEHHSTLAVARLLNERGRTTKSHRAGNGKVRFGHSWDKADVSRILRNPVYAGYMPHGDDLHEGEHQGIVEREQWQRAAALLDGATRPTAAARSRNPDYFLRGVLFCAHCGSAMTPASTRRGDREYRYYRCVKRDKGGTDRCPSRQLPARAIEGYVVDRLREAALATPLAESVTANVKARVNVRRKELLTEGKALPKEIARLSTEGQRLADSARELTGPARKIMDERLEQVGQALSRLEKRLAEVTREMATLENLEVETVWVARCLADFTACWDVLTPENRGRLTRALIQRVEVDESANRVDIHLAGMAAGCQRPAATTVQGMAREAAV